MKRLLEAARKAVARARALRTRLDPRPFVWRSVERGARLIRRGERMSGQ